MTADTATSAHSALPAAAAAADDASAAALDAVDPLRDHRDRFLTDSDVVSYLDGNSLGRPLRTTPDTLADFVRTSWGTRLIRGWDEGWIDEATVLGDRLGAVVLGAAPGQVFLGDSTSVLLYKLVRAAVDRRTGRTEIVVDCDNFPTDRYILQGIAAETGATLRWLPSVPAGGVDPDLLAGALGERTALVVLSHVAYRSGHLADAAAITAQVHDAGALVLWDLCHSAGVVPTALDEWQVDLAVGCTYKYLNGGPGSPAFGYVAGRLQEALQQPVWGWFGADQPFEMGPEYRPAAGVRRFLSGTPPVLALQPMKGMVDLIEQAGLPAIRAKSVALVAFAARLAAELLSPLGVWFGGPEDPDRRGSHIVVNHPLFRDITPELWKRGVIPDFRGPDGLRIGLSPLSTSFGEVDTGIRAIAACLTERR